VVISIGCHSQTLRDKVTTGNDVFVVIYSEVLEQPLNVKYSITEPNGTASRKGIKFYKNDSIHTSDNKDYYKNVWDKGHMAPASSFSKNKKTLYKTFSYLNSALQHKLLNRGGWKALESYERLLSLKNGKVDVEIEIHFNKIIKRVPSNAAIPSGFTKHIKYSKGVLCYYFPNKPPNKQGYKSYKIKCNKH